MSINPYGMGLRDWSDAIVLTVSTAWSLGRLTDEDDWQGWAVGIVRASPLTQSALPDPYQFDDWKDWAQRVYPMLEGQG